MNLGDWGSIASIISLIISFFVGGVAGAISCKYKNRIFALLSWVSISEEIHHHK